MTIEHEPDPAFADIEFEFDLDGRRGRFLVKDVLGAEIEPIKNPVTGADHFIAIRPPQGFEFREAEMASADLWSKGELELKAYQDNNWVVVEVADNGPGIPIEAREKVFDPFYTTKAPGEGTGLGLNISHGIVVEKHRGKISVDSKPGATRFTVKLPITDQS